MKIIKTFNSNVVLVMSDDGQEEIVMGKGIGFSKKAGEEILPSQIEKHFVYKTTDEGNDLEHLLEKINYRDIELAGDVIQLFESKLNRKMNEGSILSLADHIGFTLVRVEEGMNFRSPLEWELKTGYQDFYQVAVEAVSLLTEKTGLAIPETEAAFLTLHFINNTEVNSNGMEETILVSKVMQNIINIIKYHYQREFDQETIYFNRFFTHIRYFVKRQITGEDQVEEDETSLLSVFQVQYANDYDCAVKIKSFLEETYDWKISNDELLYLTLHLNRLTA